MTKADFQKAIDTLIGAVVADRIEKRSPEHLALVRLKAAIDEGEVGIIGGDDQDMIALSNALNRKQLLRLLEINSNNIIIYFGSLGKMQLCVDSDIDVCMNGTMVQLNAHPELDCLMENDFIREAVFKAAAEHEEHQDEEPEEPEATPAN